MLTEQEAKMKWCPWARVAMYVRGDMPDLEKPVDLVGHGCNRMCTDDATLTKKIQTAIDGTGGTKCMASACIAWEEYEPATHSADTGKEVYPAKGYCGNVGKP